MGYAAEHKDEMRAARKVRKIQKRQTEQGRRKEARMGSTVLYRGPVSITTMLDGRRVKSAMSGRVLERQTMQGAITSPVVSRRANVVVLVDPRATLSPMIAEIVDTGSDIRVHLFRCREVRGGVIVPELTICTRESTGPIMHPLMSSETPVWKTAEEIMDEALRA